MSCAGTDAPHPPFLPQHRPHRPAPGVVRADIGAFVARHGGDKAAAAPDPGVPRTPGALGLLLLPLLLGGRGAGADGVAPSFSLRPKRYTRRLIRVEVLGLLATGWKCFFIEYIVMY